MADQHWSSLTIGVLWLFTVVLYLMFMVTTDIPNSPLSRIVLLLWVLVTLFVAFITWDWFKNREESQEPHNE